MLKKFGTLGVAAMLALTCVAGCTPAPTESSSSHQSSVSDKLASTKPATNASVDGPETTQIGQGSYTLEVENKIGYTVTKVEVKQSEAAEYAAADTYEGLNLPNDKKSKLSFTPAEGTDETALYDVRLTTADEGIITIDGVPLAGLKAITFNFSKGFGYATYSLPDGNQVNTLEESQAAASEEAAAQLPSDAQSQTDDSTMEGYENGPINTPPSKPLN